MNDPIPKLSNEEISHMPLYKFKGAIEVITNQRSAKKAAKILAQEKLLGVDTETRPNFKKGENNPMAILQIANREAAYIFRLTKFPLPAQIVEIFENPQIVKAGVAIRDDVLGLMRAQSFSPQGFYEVQKMAKAAGSQNFSLRAMAALFLNIRISKKAKLSNWEHPQLTPAQLNYAATDAWVSQELYHYFQSQYPELIKQDFLVKIN